MKFVVVTGMSGAGKTTALKILENMHFFCVDNLPGMLLSKFADLCFSTDGEYDRVAVCVDVRGKKHFGEIYDSLKHMEECGYQADILFLNSNEQALVNRYNFTRQIHPLAAKNRTISDCIKLEKELLSDIRKKATILLDTSKMTASDIKESLQGIYGENNTQQARIFSFGFKRGIPVDADYVFDVRFLPNPYNVPELRPHSGKEECVIEYLNQYENFSKTVDLLVKQLEFIVPQYSASGKQMLNFAVGCTGGFHRSVAIAEAVSKKLNQNGLKVECFHRDINKD